MNKQAELLGTLEEYKSKLRASEVNHQNLINIIERETNGIIIIDQNGLVRFANPAAAELFARPVEEIINKHFGYPLELNEKIQIKIFRNDGSTGIAEMQISQTIWDDQPAYLACLNDVTKYIKVKEALEDYTSQLKRSNYELDNLASVASHDMNDPLKKIINYGEKLTEGLKDKLKTKEKNYLEKITNSARRLQDLIDGLLHFSRVSSRAKPFENINLNLVLKAVLSDFEDDIAMHNVRINILQDLPTVFADKIQMHQLLQNLVSNAIKFRKQNQTPVVNIGSELKNGDWQIYVEDNGIGFDNKLSEKILKQFVRLNEDEYNGNGIGLAICERIAKRHHGSIKAESKPGQGSIFIFSIPDRTQQTINAINSQDLIRSA